MTLEKIIHAYSSPFNFGHKALEEIWNGVVVCQEKVDGSQFSFSMVDGELVFRSRGQAIDVQNPQMFALGVQSISELAKRVVLPDGWTYRGEFLSTPKHNTITYARVPKDYVILFDIDKGDQDYLLPEELQAEASRTGLEVVPFLGEFRNIPPSIDQVTSMLQNVSVLGGHKVEGVVFKNYQQFGRDKKVLMAKYVSEEFVETHKKDWKDRNPHQALFLDKLIEEYRTEARWAKAVQHLRENGAIQGEVQDIPVLLREVGVDVLKDHEAEIKDALFKFFWKQISKGLVRGLPEWYKESLMKAALE